MDVNSAHLSVVQGASATGDGKPDDRATADPHRGDRRSVEDVADDFVAIYKAHYPRLVRALELSGTDRQSAEDLAQEAFARTLGHWKRVRRGTNPAGYAYRVAFRLARRGREQNLALIAEPATTPDISAEVALSVEIERVIRAMPLAQRRCAVLCLVIGSSASDAAHVLRIAESTVRKQIERARNDLRQVLASPA